MASRASRKRSARKGVATLTAAEWLAKTTRPRKQPKPAKARSPKPMPRALRRAGWLGTMRKLRRASPPGTRAQYRIGRVDFSGPERIIGAARQRAPYGDRVASTGLPGRRPAGVVPRAWVAVAPSEDRASRRGTRVSDAAKVRRLARLHVEHDALTKAAPSSRDEKRRLRLLAYQIREATPKAATDEAT